MTVMGHKTGVNQMLLARAPFGRRGGYLAAWLQFLTTMGWIGVNTYFPVELSISILGHFGVHDSFWVKFLGTFRQCSWSLPARGDVPAPG